MASGNVDAIKKQTELETSRSEKLKAILEAKRELMRVRSVNDGISKQIAGMTKDNVDAVEPPAPVVKKRQMLD
jgi:Mg2+ and Co2+ transporter CorA